MTIFKIQRFETNKVPFFCWKNTAILIQLLFLLFFINHPDSSGQGSFWKFWKSFTESGIQTYTHIGVTCSALGHNTILACLHKLVLKLYYITKSLTKAPIALSIYSTWPIFYFLTSIFEFSEAAPGWEPRKIDPLDPYRVSKVKFPVACLLQS